MAEMLEKSDSSYFASFRNIMQDVVAGKTLPASSPGARFTKQTYNNFYPEFLVKQSYNIF